MTQTNKNLEIRLFQMELYAVEEVARNNSSPLSSEVVQGMANANDRIRKYYTNGARNSTEVAKAVLALQGQLHGHPSYLHAVQMSDAVYEHTMNL